MKSEFSPPKKLQATFLLVYKQLTTLRTSPTLRTKRIGFALFLFGEMLLATFGAPPPASAAPVSVNICFKTNSELDLNSTANANTKAKLTNAAYFGTGGTAAPETFVFKTLATVTNATLSSNNCQIYFGGGALTVAGDLTIAEMADVLTWVQSPGHFLLAGCDYAPSTGIPGQVCSSFRTMTDISNGGISSNSLLSYNPLLCGGALSVSTFGGVSSYFTMLPGDVLLGTHNTTAKQPAVITDSLTSPKFLFTGDADMYGSSGATAIGAGATASTDQAKFVVNSFKFALDAIMGRLSNPQCFSSYDQKSDLELSISTSNTSPIVGGQTTVVVTLNNKGPNNVTGVAAKVTLPAGLTLASQTGTGSYSAATKVWTIGAVNNGASASITLTVDVTSSGSFSIPAEITSSSLADIDSATNSGFGVDDLSDGVADDDEASVVVSASLPVYTITGNVFEDLDGSKVKAASGENYTAANITAVLLDASSKVVSTAAVDAMGSYTLNNVSAGTYSVKIIQTPGTALTTGVVIPPVNDILPTNWVATGENNNGTPDATVDRTQTVTVASANIANINFGIEQRPTAVGGTASTQVNPGALTTVPSSVFTGSTDPDGTVASYKITAFPSNASSVQINGTSYTSVNFPASGVTVTAAQLSTLKVFPNAGAVTVDISFQAIDNAGQSSSNISTAALPFTAPATNPNLLLVKRITAINGGTATVAGDNLAIYNQNDAYPYDDNLVEPNLAPNASAGFPTADTDKWPNTIAKSSSGFLIGGQAGGQTRPQDEVEYTIYFLSAGSAPAGQVTLCDRIPANQTFISDAYNVLPQAAGGNSLANRGIAVSSGSSSPLGYTNLIDGDTAQYFASGSTLPGACGAAANTTGAVVVNLGIGATNALGGTVPNAITPGRPTDSYGFFRFKAKVN